MTALTPELIAARHPDTPLGSLAVKENNLTNASLSGLVPCAPTLTTLDVSSNQLASFSNLDKLTNLISLTVSNNQIARLSYHLLGLAKLKALVAVGNKIATIENLSECVELNTLVISHNQVAELKGLDALKELTKINASHNPIRVIPDLSKNAKLKELRLNDCQLSVVPESIGGNPALEVVNLGNNQIKSFTDIVPLAALSHLVDLNLKGNPITSEPDYEEKVKTLFPTLRVLDGKRFDPRYLKNKAKRQALEVRKKLKELGIEKPVKGLRLKETLAGGAGGRQPASGSGSGSDEEAEDRMDVDTPQRKARARPDSSRPTKADMAAKKKRSASQRDDAADAAGTRAKRSRKEVAGSLGGNVLGGKPSALGVAKKETPVAAKPADSVAPSAAKPKPGNKSKAAVKAPASADESSSIVASKDDVLAPPPSVTGVVEVVVAKHSAGKKGTDGKVGAVDRAMVVKELEQAAAKEEMDDGFGLGVGGWD
ncbi:hypothetical protein BCR44DRAFT_1440157 [Catenaria anguillulae PL171]|uniref:Protein phosphatase 1 regulatory subunit 7 n=1 Tax=Catenaria anguillulae PL171 TaxID=765915 RepID=A0A1Y2HCV0_9FUNG|nr:hypothetical protein BCR44DRAFT_1440157 [Catenaria anguillulae PL171]